MSSKDEIKIDRDIPMPDNIGRGGISRYPWDTMEIGESFVIEIKIASFRRLATHAGPRHGRKFATRKMPDGSYRCWRTE